MFTNGYEYFKAKKEARTVSTISFFLECLSYAEKRIKKLNLNFLHPFVLLCVRNTIHSEASVINYLILLYLRDVEFPQIFYVSPNKSKSHCLIVGRKLKITFIT